MKSLHSFNATFKGPRRFSNAVVDVFFDENSNGTSLVTIVNAF